MKFFVQHNFPSAPIYDFEFELFSVKNYNSWYKPDDNFIISDKVDNKSCPVGSVEFVTNFYNKYYNLQIKPKNIPDVFFNTDFINTPILNYSPNDELPTWVNENDLHIKHNDIIKGDIS